MSIKKTRGREQAALLGQDDCRVKGNNKHQEDWTVGGAREVGATSFLECGEDPQTNYLRASDWGRGPPKDHQVSPTHSAK